MKQFDYLRPGTPGEAVAAWHSGAAYLGGGTNLVDLMKTGALQPEKLIDITRLPGLDRIERLPDGGIRIGALVRNSDLATDPGIARDLPMLSEALLSGASGQLRNAATVGGNLMQRTRCAYFQDPTSPCNRREPGSGCGALGGETHNHAILGWSEHCIATNPSDFCVPLAALDAVVEVQGPDGRREIPMAEFHRLPGDDPSNETALASGELILAVTLPGTATETRGNSRYLKVRERTSFAFALVSAAAGLQIETGRIVQARLALGGVAAKPWRVPEAEKLLLGEAPSEELFARAAETAIEGAAPSGDNAYKIDLARRTAARALALAAEGTPAEMPALPASPHGVLAHA